MLVREHSPVTRKRARRAAGTPRGSRAEELADVTFMLPDDLLLLLVRWRRHAHPPTSANPGQVVLPSRSPQHSCLAAAVHLTDDVGEVGLTPPSPQHLTLSLAL